MPKLKLASKLCPIMPMVDPIPANRLLGGNLKGAAKDKEIAFLHDESKATTTFYEDITDED